MAKLFSDDIVIPEMFENETQQPQAVSPLSLHALLNKTMQNLEEQLEVFFQQWGITTGRFEILSLLRKEKAGITPSNIAKSVGVTNATISAILSGLKEAGLIQSEQNAGDSRSYRVQLSQNGVNLMNQICPVYEENIARMWSQFETNEKTYLETVFKKINQALPVMGKRN